MPTQVGEELTKVQTVINLSKTFTLSVSQSALLNKGLSFVPTCTLGRDLEKRFKCDLQGYHRRIKLISFFKDDTHTMLPFGGPSDWTPPSESIPQHVHDLIARDKLTVKNHYKTILETPNTSPSGTQALKELQRNRQIVIKPADKGSALVILDRDQYVMEVERQLNDTAYYRRLDSPIYLETVLPVTRIINSLHRSKYINDKQRRYLIGDGEPRPRRFYILPKIHKDPTTWTIPFEIPPGRPIVSDCGSETYGTAEFLDHFLNPLSIKHPSYIKDTYHFVEIVKALIVPSDCYLFSLDVKSLYTNIPIPAGIQCVKNIFEKFPDPERPDRQLLQLLDINLTRNDFEFNGQFYLQVKGTAMGKRFAPAYANIFMANWEEEVFNKCHIKPLKYYRYLDDIWGLWSGSESDFIEFMSILNAHDPSIQLTHELSHSTIDFLDTTVYKGPQFCSTSTFDVKVFFKKTDTHALLYRRSFHPRHTFGGLVKSQILRFHRICTRKSDFSTAVRILFRALRSRGYSRSFLRTCFKTFLATKMRIRVNPIPLIITYSSVATALSTRLKHNFTVLLGQQVPFVDATVISAFRRNKNLGDILVRARLSSLVVRDGPVERKRDTRLVGLRFVQNLKNHTWFQLTQSFAPDSHNCVYLLYCSRCPAQFVGETGVMLSTRMRQHEADLHGGGDLDSPLIQHFLSHGPDTMRFAGLQRNILWTLDQRREREGHWIVALNATPIRPQ